MLPIVALGVSLFVLLLTVHVDRKARRTKLAVAFALKRATMLRDEITLTIIENDRLRREGVWFDPASGRWMARLAIDVTGESEREASIALAHAVRAIAAAVPGGRQRVH